MSRFGFVTIIGRPNTGKSTLLNTLAGTKLCVVSTTPQTTRHPVRLVLEWNDARIALFDLPGYAKPKTLLGKRLNENIRSFIAHSHACIFLVDAAVGVGKGDEYLANFLLKLKVAVVCAVNKVDAASRDRVAIALARLGEISEFYETAGGVGFREFVPVSAKTGLGIEKLLEAVVDLLPERDQPYDDVSSLTALEESEMYLRVAEIIREKLIEGAREELPYSIAVIVEDISARSKDDEDLIEISAKVLVERESQKAIVIGSRGERLKRVGTQAREELELLFGAHVFLNLKVVVEKNWQQNPKILEKMGL